MALGLGLEPSPPTIIPSPAGSPPSFGSTWGNPRYHITSLHISSAFHYLLPGPWDPPLWPPSTSLGGELHSCLKQGVQKGTQPPSVAGLWAHRPLALTSDTESVGTA